VEPATARAPAGRPSSGFQLVRYRPLFSGAAVERVPELQFQRPVPELELPHAQASERGIRTGDAILVSSNGTSRELVARLNRRLVPGVARLANEHASGLNDVVEIAKA
jgi:anaerobic selenocysteine-containing dehydrogenase